MQIIREFREFALRGNVLDLAVAFILGVAFAKITTSLVNDVLMPPVGLLLGNVDFGNLFVNLGGGDYATLAEAEAAGAPTINYGAFVNVVIEFLIIAFVVFLIVRQVNWLKKRGQPVPQKAPETKACPFCVSAIPVAASRCPQCTSMLEGATTPSA